MKQVTRLTEFDLNSVIKESINKVLNEIGDTKNGRDKINTAMKNSFTKDLKKKMKSKEIQGGFSNSDKRKRVNSYMENGPHGEEWHEEHGKNWALKESNIHDIFHDRNKSFEERLHRLGLTITDKERELEALQKEYLELKEEWEEDTQNYNDRFGQYYGE